MRGTTYLGRRYVLCGHGRYRLSLGQVSRGLFAWLLGWVYIRVCVGLISVLPRHGFLLLAYIHIYIYSGRDGCMYGYIETRTPSHTYVSSIEHEGDVCMYPTLCTYRGAYPQHHIHVHK